MTKKTLALALCTVLSWSYVTASDDNYIPPEETIIKETTTTEMAEQARWEFVKKMIIDKTESEQNWLIPRVAGFTLGAGAITAAPFLIFMFLINKYYYYEQNEENERFLVRRWLGAFAAILGISSAISGAKTGLSNHKLMKLRHLADYVRNWDNYKNKTPQELHPSFEELHYIYQKLTLLPEFQEVPQDLSELYLQKISYQKYDAIKELVEAQGF